ncbi:hypothetical protein E1200_32810 [Actinomadura sp. GC306]|nr:hypothetical protein E1200_32810 [Actinomadura sp. GC306]
MTAQYPPAGTARRRPVLPAILAGAVVATAILAVAGFVLWPDGPSGGGPEESRQPTTVAKQSIPAERDTPTVPATEPASSGGPSRTALPDGLVRSAGPGFSIAIPRGWQRTEQGNSVIWNDPASTAYIQVDRTPWTGDPYDHWLTWEREAIADGKLRNFRRIAITETSVLGVPAADIEFTWVRDSGLTRARDRGVIAGGRSYAVIVAVPAARWNENEALVNNVLDTFRPSGVG